MNSKLGVAVLAATLAVGALRADDLPAELAAVRIEQRLGEQVPLDLEFRDEMAKAVRLADFFEDKPVILVLAYYRCPRLCSLVLNGLGDCLQNMSLTPGQEFKVVVVSFDPRETPELAAA